jgi:hypothetical protein
VGDVIGASLGSNSNGRGAEACLVSRGRRCRGARGVCAVGSTPTARYCVRCWQVKDVRACIGTAILRAQNSI